MHDGVNETLCNIRQQYWIPKPRTEIKRVFRQCVTCRKVQGKPYSYPKEPDLPKERVAASHSFETAGIDYLGPVYVNNIFSKDNTMHKAWIWLTTCATTRAIYLDLVSDCSGSSCFNLLRRLTAVHGTPKVMISDSGTNFICEEVQSYVEQGNIVEVQRTESPLVRKASLSVERCLRKVLTKARLTFIEMLTVVNQVENIINSQPLTYLYTVENIEPLTPNKLIYGRSIDDTIMNNDVERDVSNLNERFLHLQKLLNHFWKRWSKECLVSLRRSSIDKENGRTQHPRIGDVVVVHDDNLRRQSWRIGKIIKLITIKDGQIRACELIASSNGKTAMLRRPISRLYPFEHGRSQEDTETGKPAIKFVDDRDIVTFFAVAVAAGIWKNIYYLT